MKRLLLLFTLALLIFPCAAVAATKSETPVPEYEISGTDKTAAQGTYIVNVTVLSKKSNIDTDLLSRAAVHGVLFRGIPGSRSGSKPILGSAAVEAQHAEYFKNFFAPNGPARNYTSEVPGSRKVVKSGKQYRVTSTMVVQKDQLRKDMEQAGIGRGLNSAF